MPGLQARSGINAEQAKACAKYGIVKVPIDYFHYKEFRYTNLDDAIAQARRQNPGDRADGSAKTGPP
jgi:hypothetical protein